MLYNYQHWLFWLIVHLHFCINNHESSAACVLTVQNWAEAVAISRPKYIPIKVIVNMIGGYNF